PVELDTGTLYLRGAIDRVDRIGPQLLSVRDLKTGRVYDFNEQPINPVRDLQIGLYVLALEASGLIPGARAENATYVHPSAAQEPGRVFAGPNLELLRKQMLEWLTLARRLLSRGIFPRTTDPRDCTYCPFLPACGEDAQKWSALKLNQALAGDALELF